MTAKNIINTSNAIVVKLKIFSRTSCEVKGTLTKGDEGEFASDIE